MLRTTKVPHLLKGSFRDDIVFRLKFIFLTICTCYPSLPVGNAAQGGYEIAAQFLFSATLTQTLNNLSFALTGAAITPLANPLTFIAAGAAVGFWYFFPKEKGLGPRGYERNEIVQCLVRTTKHKNICFCLWQRIFDTFFLIKKYPKNQERTMLPPHRAKHLARRSFIPPRGYSGTLGICFFS